MKYFGHIKRHNGTEKVILDGTRQGKEEKEDQMESDIKEHYGSALIEEERLAQNRGTFMESGIHM